ncbi:MAG: O-acetylhomoserine sulfhydrylase [Chloroflexi bacterium]|jgi:cystathionine beta-lyase/cystathionine gamma-synthase|nr:O-acetylhomoserine sulfhydrylase [Chloroflexota bacterium]MDB5076202.1 O-acetylhomoserine sulfhydrylase [Chloroflexota bacterium]
MHEHAAFSTRAAYAGRMPVAEPVSRPLLAPIYQSTVYAFDSLEDLEAFHDGAPGHIYYRNGTLTNTTLEAGIAALESAEAAVTAGSGMAIITAAILALAGAGDRVVADRHAYGGTYTLLTKDLPRLGIEVLLIDATNLDDVARALEGQPKALLIEALSNPTLRVVDVPALSALGRSAGVPVIVDATFASPALLRPVEFGASLSWHSVAKYLGGHSAAMGGVAAGDRDLVELIREKIVHLGACQGVMDAWLTLLGLPTLPLRMPVHSQVGMAIARYLETHAAVAKVLYPGLSSHPHYALAQTLYPTGCGGMMSFELRGGTAAARHFLKALKLIAFAPSLADVTTTVSYPYATSHYRLPEDALAALGVTQGLIRLSAGIEAEADVLADLEQALEGCPR